MSEEINLVGYAFVNEKEFEGRNYRAYRSITNPRDCIIIVDDSVRIPSNTLKNYWMMRGSNNN